MITRKDLENIHLYCFDINQNNHRVRKLLCNVMANFDGVVYVSEDIKIEIYYYCQWINNKWVITQNEKEIVQAGVDSILYSLNLIYKNKKEE